MRAARGRWARPLSSAGTPAGTGDTIFALSSAPGRCGVAVIRASGPGSRGALQSLTGTPEIPPPRVLALRRIRDPHTAETLDAASWSGRVPGLRPAEPGEFTRRAFRHGKLDLTAAEGLRDLIGAETEAQRRQALRQMEGDLGQLYQRWSHTLTQALAHLEAFIDFGEDEEVEEEVLEQVAVAVRALQRDIGAHLRDGRRGELLRAGVRAVIAGPPNVGKSSLLNLLCRRPAAIVSPQAGTTRDVLEVALDIGGFPLVLSDTAGLRQASDPRGARGGDAGAGTDTPGWDNSPNPRGNRSRVRRLRQADLVLAVLDATAVCAAPAALGAALAALEPPPGVPCGDPLSGSPSLTQARHSRHLGACAAALSRFCREDSGDIGDLAVAAEQLRVARRELGRITGHVGAEEVLDIIFRDFCVGK
ncbi:hypothetical protein DUI87_33772 [Hirundo rustica rustica]|uniref:TrmE-type G domain-containing protein n=1 Tax=Hirundo rustica rustica TaxID=333673 RepID=A0A3M0ILB7_HIRRU|nr:hypothetical protein DUI87_33772 [Hirundo rustica rustica]